MMKLNHPYTGFNDENFANLEDRVSALEEGGGGSTVSVTQVVTSGEKLATITVDDTPTDIYAPTDTGDTVSVTQVVTSGEKLATITVNDTPTDIYAPTDTGDTVTVTQVQSTGTKIATIGVNGTDTDLYAPNGGGTSEYDEIIYFVSSDVQNLNQSSITPSSTNCSHTMAEFYALVSNGKKVGGVLVDNLTDKNPQSYFTPLIQNGVITWKYLFRFDYIGNQAFNSGIGYSVILGANDNQTSWTKVGSDVIDKKPYTYMEIVNSKGFDTMNFSLTNDRGPANNPVLVTGSPSNFRGVPSDMSSNSILYCLTGLRFGILWGDITEYYYTTFNSVSGRVWTKHFFDSSILVSPNNTQYRIKVDDNGTLSTEAVV